jgi:electron transfer flavoprotein alpha subunit
MSVLVIAEHDNASVKGATLNTVTAAAACGGDVHVLVAGHNAGAAAAAAAQIAGVAKVLHADDAALGDQLAEADRKSTRLNSSHNSESRMPSSA